MRFPFVRPKLPPPSAWIDHLAESYDRGYFTNFGPAEQRLTSALKERFAADGTTCVLCTNATAGLTASLIASGVMGPVLVPAFTFPATLHAVLSARLDAVLCDVDPDTWEMEPHSAAAALDKVPRTAALMPVRVFGMVRDHSGLAETARARGLSLIADAAAAFGNSRIDCTGSDHFRAEVVSLHATKSFGIGEGGAIFVDSSREAGVRKALNFGLNADRSFDFGLNGKMSDFQAAVGLGTLEMLDRLIEGRAEMCRFYDELLGSYHSVSRARARGPTPSTNYPIMLGEAVPVEEVCARALERGLQLRRYYFPSLSRMSLAGMLKPVETPVADNISSRMICLPIYSDATNTERNEIAAELERVFDEFSIR